MKTEIRMEEPKSYANLENLRIALKKYELDHVRHLVVKTENNRFTAVFRGDAVAEACNGYAMAAAQHGFTTI